MCIIVEQCFHVFLLVLKKINSITKSIEVLKPLAVVGKRKA